jgi:outer membrane biosynthesis protein TonB
MKWILIIQLAFSMNYIFAQNLDSKDTLVFVTPLEILPKWTEGTNKELIQEITMNIKYPNGQCIAGITVLQFKVDTLGQVKEPKIMRSLSKEIDEQLLKIIWNYKFEPGILIDKKAEFNLNLPIRIKLE